MSLQAIISQLSRALEHPAPTNPLAFHTSEELEVPSIHFDNAIECARRNVLSNGGLSSNMILDGRQSGPLIFDNRGITTTAVNQTAIVGSRAAAAAAASVTENNLLNLALNGNFARYQPHLNEMARAGLNVDVDRARIPLIDKNGQQGLTPSIGAVSTEVSLEALDRRITRSACNTIGNVMMEGIEMPTVNYDRKRRRTISDEDEIKGLITSKSAKHQTSKNSPQLSLELPTSQILIDSNQSAPEGASVIQCSPSFIENNAQVLDFRVRIPENESRHNEIMNALHQILEQVKELNSRTANMQLGPERFTERRRSERRTGIASELFPQRFSERRSQRTHSIDFNSDQLPAEKKAATLRALIPTHFQEIRGIVEEIMEPLLSKSVRSCRVCHQPYSIQRNKDVLEFRCRGKEHETSVYGGRIPDHVLDAAWDVIQERGMETLTYFKSTHRRGPHRERDAIGLREREFPPHEKESFFQTELSEGLQTKPSPTDIHQTPSQEAIESPLHEGSLHEDDVALYLESLLPPEDESPAFDPEVVKYDPESTDIRVVGLEIVAQVLPIEQRTCKLCGDLYSLNRNKGALEFRCRNGLLHSPSLYGGRVPREVMDQIHEVIRQRELREIGSDSAFSDEGSTKRKKKKKGFNSKKCKSSKTTSPNPSPIIQENNEFDSAAGPSVGVTYNEGESIREDDSIRENQEAVEVLPEIIDSIGESLRQNNIEQEREISGINDHE